MAVLRERFGVSERRACAVVGLHRSTMRLTPPPITDEEAELRAWLRTFSTDRPRWGWRRAAIAARKAGWKVNNKRIRRLWREEGLRVPQRRKKKRLTGIGVPVGAMCPTVLIQTRQRLALDPHIPLRRGIQPREQSEQGRLARTRGAHDGNRLRRGDRKRDIVQNRQRTAICECDRLSELLDFDNRFLKRLHENIPVFSVGPNGKHRARRRP